MTSPYDLDAAEPDSVHTLQTYPVPFQVGRLGEPPITWKETRACNAPFMTTGAAALCREVVQ